MPTISQLRTRAEYMVDDYIEDHILIELFNAAQEDLSEVAGYTKVAEAEFYNKDPIVTLPLDFIELEELKIKLDKDKEFSRMKREPLKGPGDFDPLNTPDQSYYKFEQFGESIEIKPIPKDSGKLLIRYFAMLPEIPPDDDSYRPKLHERYHELLPLYVAMRYAQNWKDVLDEKKDFETEYRVKKQELEQYMQKKKGRNHSNKVYMTERWF